MTRNGPPNSTVELPLVSVVVPVRNEASSIEACLHALLRQDYPATRIELIVVDGDSSDDTKTLVEAIAARHPDRVIRIHANPQRRVSCALNIGIRDARADIVVRMDGHTTASTSYVASCVRAMRATGAANVGGRITPIATARFARSVAHAQRHVLGAGGAKFHYASRPQFVDTVYLGAFDKAALRRSGLYDENLHRNQDYELNVRIRKCGGKIYLDPSIESHYTPRDTPTKLWKQYYDYGWWKVETLRRHPDSLRPRQLAPAVFVGGLALLSGLGFAVPPAWSLAALLLGGYGLALGFAAVNLSVRREEATFASLLGFPLALAIMHVAWGLGFLSNVVSVGRFPYRSRPPLVPRLT